MSIPFVGRQNEIRRLEKLLKKGSASLAVIMGRRRIGKTRLVEEFAKNQTFYHFSGIPPSPKTTEQGQLDDFAQQMSIQFGIPELKVNDWNKLFFFLAERVKKGKVIILLDEISWMGSKDPDFLGKLKNAWDIYFKKNPKLILVLCGSVSSWIEKNILSSTGFVGRIDLTLTIKELPLQDCNTFWLRNNSYASPYEKLKVLSVTGGVPRYLEAINTSLPADENIKDLCFLNGGLLVNEFNNIFTDIFIQRESQYKKLITTLSNGPLEAKEIAKKAHVTYTGTIIEYLEDLVTAGFLRRDYTWHFSSGKPSSLSHFRLSDNYVRFYLKYMAPVLTKIKNDDYQFTSLSSLPGWDTIMGYQCENLLLNNRDYIKDCLNLNPGDILNDNPFFQRKTNKIPGCQIDYLIQTRFGGLYVCEFKFSKHPVDTSVIQEVQQKISRLVYPKGFSIWPVLIHVNGIQEDVTNSGFFSHIIDFGKLLQPLNKA